MTAFTTQQVPGHARRAIEVDIFSPVERNGVAVILLHGGGWAQGHRSMVHGAAAALASAGFVAIAAEYRLLPEAAWPAQIDDVRDVVRWIRANAAALGIDPEKIALQGFSAGGHLALLVAGTQPGSGNETGLGADSDGTTVAAVVSFFAPARLDADEAALQRPPLSLLVGERGREGARAASPVYYLNPRFPTTFLVGGMADYMQPLAAGLYQLQAFVTAGVNVEFHYFHSQRHEFQSVPGMTPGVMAEVAFFYHRTLIASEELHAEAVRLNPFARASSAEEFFAMMAASPRS